MSTSSERREEIFIAMAYLVAMQSKDARTRIGAVVVGPDNEVRSTGYNGLPRGCNDDVIERQEKPMKYFYFEHAERNAIYNAARMGLSMKGCTLYTMGVPCSDCARAIIQSGIVEVVYHKQWNDENYPNWDESAKHSVQMFNECGVMVSEWSGTVLKIQALQHGEHIIF